jgi:hypothetical protein
MSPEREEHRTIRKGHEIAEILLKVVLSTINELKSNFS